MLMKEIRVLAKKMGLKPGRLSKMNLIRLIQKSEGNNICFGSNQSASCGQPSCLWLDDCQKADS